jgi:hypothetical protein
MAEDLWVSLVLVASASSPGRRNFVALLLFLRQWHVLCSPHFLCSSHQRHHGELSIGRCLEHSRLVFLTTILLTLVIVIVIAVILASLEWIELLLELGSGFNFLFKLGCQRNDLDLFLGKAC